MRNEIVFNVRCPECHKDDGTGGNPWFRPQFARLHFECLKGHRHVIEGDVHPGLKFLRAEIVPDVDAGSDGGTRDSDGTLGRDGDEDHATRP